MVFTLHRYIFRELTKVFALAALGLTLILSLGSILRPVQEYGVGPQQVVHLIGYFLPITLTFVLPMAALFAAALVYGRFASDNELDACKASGISLLTLVYPGLVLAIIVAIANLLLSFYVMPVFVHRAERALKANAKQILFRNIQRRGFYELPPDGRYRIYADLANAENDSLLGVVVTELKGVEIKRIITAESAKVYFEPHERFNKVQITAHNTYQMASDNEGWFFVEWLPITKEFGSLLGDDIKFKKVDEMKRIRGDPMEFYPIEKKAGQVYAEFVLELLAQDISGKISRKENKFYKLHSGDEIVEFTAESCRVSNEKEIELSGNVEVIESDVLTQKPLRTLQSQKASLHIEGEDLAPTLTMVLYNAKWIRQDSQEGRARRSRIRGLLLPQTITGRFKTANVLEAIRPASIASALVNGPSPKLESLQAGLEREIKSTLAEIKAEMHSRLVFGIGCVTLILIAIALGIIFRGGHLLTAFGASSIPAAVLIVCIMMGRNITKNLGAQAGSGIVLMWAGLGFLSLLAVALYHNLLKH